FYSYSPAVELINQRGPVLFAHLGLDAAARQQLSETFRSVQKTTGLPDGLVARIAEGHIDGLLVDGRVKYDAAAAEADAQALNRRIADGQAEIRERLIRMHGVKDGEQLFERTRRFVLSHPKLAAILREDGLGARPDLVEGVAAYVFSSGWR
ncbi:MAG: hypothetical protein ACRDH5_17485, partial [bacterium]